MTSEPDDPAKSAVTVPIRVTPKPAAAAPEVPADPPSEPAVAPPTVETPAVEIPAVETPAVEAPTVETPAVEPPTVETYEFQPDSRQPEPESLTPDLESPTSEPRIPEPSAEQSASPVSPVPARRPARTRAGGIGVAIVLVAAGLLFTTSATTARGTQFRSERADLADLIAAEDLRVKSRNQRVTTLRKQVEEGIAANTVNSKAIKSLEEQSADVVSSAGLLPVHGPGLTVSLDDAPRDVPVPADAGPDDLVVHQQDVQAVVNALWAGGAEAMMLQDQRVISTSAVRCVGNTLILQGRVYSPPYRITVIGDVPKMQASLDSSPQIAYYLQYVASLRLGWSVKRSDRLELPAYTGSLSLSHARVAGSGTESSSSGAASSSP